jgi:glycosyltransferase involved in cell wall biosynthesis
LYTPFFIKLLFEKLKKDKKKILIISSPSTNNASGVIAYDLHKTLGVNYNSEIITKHDSTKEKHVISYTSTAFLFFEKLSKKLKRTLFPNKEIKTNPDYYFFDINQNKTLINLNKLIKKVKEPDIFIAYFMGNFFTIKDLHKLQQYYKAPIILIMADMVHITGGCHYAWDCDGYKKDCSNCPAIIEKQHQHFASDNLKLNKQLIDKMDISIIALSSQDYGFAKKSTLFKHKKVNFVLGGINLDTFYFQNKQATLKSNYGIKNDDFVILFGSVNIGEKRKGVKYFVEAINYLNKENLNAGITIVTIGNGQLEKLLTNTKFNIINLGYISDYKKLALAYNIADVFVTTTIQDSGPMMVNQSIACGTPVVCFDIGVAKDIVIKCETGYKAELFDSVGIANGISKLIGCRAKEYEKIRSNCSTLAKKEFSKNVSAERIMNTINL